MYLTHISASFEADTFFPEFDENNWSNSVLMEHRADEKNKYDFEIKVYESKA